MPQPACHTNLLRPPTALGLVITLALALSGCVSHGTHQQTLVELAKLNQQTAALRQELATLKEQLTRAEEAGKECNQLLDTERALGSDRQASLERARNDIERLERIIGERDQETGKGIAELRETIEALRAENQNLQKQLPSPAPAPPP